MSIALAGGYGCHLGFAVPVQRIIQPNVRKTLRRDRRLNGLMTGGYLFGLKTSRKHIAANKDEYYDRQP